ncbi:MAG: hypothetical protein ABSC60_05810 [Acidobacteriota bacterium]
MLIMLKASTAGEMERTDLPDCEFIRIGAELAIRFLPGQQARVCGQIDRRILPHFLLLFPQQIFQIRRWTVVVNPAGGHNPATELGKNRYRNRNRFRFSIPIPIPI